MCSSYKFDYCSSIVKLVRPIAILCLRCNITVAMSIFQTLSFCFVVIAMFWQRAESVESYDEYYLGGQGQSCNEVCGQRGLVCTTRIETGDSAALFEKLGVGCIADNRTWWAQDQPCYVNDLGDVNHHRCLGFREVPSSVSCDSRHSSVRRLCRCLPSPVYLMGSQGQDCNAACSRHGLRCSTSYKELYGSVSKFFELGVSCKPDYRYWWAHHQPCYVVGYTDPNRGRCLGFVKTPAYVRCNGKHPAVRRLCHCESELDFYAS